MGKNVVMNVDAKGLTPGVHAIHIHDKPDCSARTELLPADIGILQEATMANGVQNISIWEI